MTTSSKSLSEQVNEIKSAKMSKVAKKRAILGLGFTNYEANLLMTNSTEPKSSMPTER